MAKYRFDAKKNGKIEKWSGVFETKQLANRWYNEHGQFFEKLGFELILTTNYYMRKKKSKWNQPDKENEALIKNLQSYADGNKGVKDVLIHQLHNRAKKYHLEIKEVGAVNLQSAIDMYKSGNRPIGVMLNQIYSSL